MAMQRYAEYLLEIEDWERAEFWLTKAFVHKQIRRREETDASVRETLLDLVTALEKQGKLREAAHYREQADQLEPEKPTDTTGPIAAQR